ncbi:MAG TPA: transglycosylase SLT domain-containing protein [Pyrinomonadaceae bacterium]|jgi:soluble lytic murein transglycosylase
MLLARLLLLTVCWVSVGVAQAQSNQDYLLGRKAEASGDIATATANYQAVVSRNSILKEYALWRLARIARATGDLLLERERLQQLIATAPNSLLYETAALRLSESFFESSDFVAAANNARALSQSKNVPVAREAAALMGTAYVRAGKVIEARDTFTKLVMQMPDASRPDDFALIAVRELDALEKSANAPALSEAEHLLRASVYQFNRDFAGARAHYQALINQYPQSGTLPNAILQLGRGYYLENKYDDAVKAFQKVVDAYPQNDAARDALGFLGSTYLRTKRTDDAITAYKLLSDRFPNSPTPERPFLNIIDALHEAGRYAEALNWVQQTRARFKSDIGGALALFAQLRIHLAQASWAAAVRDAEELAKFSDLGGTRVPGGTNPTEVSFLRAYALEQLGRTEDAVAAYLAIPDGRNEYYGARATQRLLGLAKGDKSRALVQMRLNALMNEAKVASAAGQWEQARIAGQIALRLTTDGATRAAALKYLSNAYQALPAYRLPKFNKISPTATSESDPQPTHEALADALLALGLYDEALPEFLASTAAKTTTPASDQAYTIAMLSLQAGLPNRAVRFAEQLWKGMPADYVIDLAPRDLVELLYPAPFRESLLQHATSRSVDPRFVLSIARQESRFQAEAKSAAAARGMMQFIPSTANDTAAELKLAKFEQDDLYNADTALLFGAQYLSNLFKQFPDQPQAVAGAYNGGADNLARWIARSRSNEADRYVSEIGFSQTKDYVYKVMTNFWNYQRLYDAQLQPISGAAK